MSQLQGELSVWDELVLWFDGARIAATVAIAVLVGFAGWYFLIRDDGDSPQPEPGPERVSVAQLRSLADSVGHPVYWAGKRGESSYELTHTSDGRIYVRYLPEGTQIGDPRPAFLTVGTYPVAGAFEALKRASERPGSIVRTVANRGFVVTHRAQRTSVYLGYPKSDYEIEVYDPSAKRALTFATSGQVRPIR